MSDRITRKDVERIAAAVTDGLRGDVSLVAQGRNGYVGLDLYRDGAQVDTLHIGTTREVYTYLQGMRRLQLIV